jgi:hypothetical protein
MDDKEFEKKVQAKLNEQKGGVDPATMGNGARSKPKYADNHELGRKLYQRLKQNGKIRKK